MRKTKLDESSEEEGEAKVIKPQPRKKRIMIPKSSGRAPLERKLQITQDVPEEEVVFTTPIVKRPAVEVKVELLDKHIDFARFKKRKRRF